MIHNSSTGGKDNKTNTPGRQELIDPVLKLWETNIETRGDDTTFVQSTVELDNNLSRPVVIDLLEFANVTYKLAYVK